MGRFTLALLLVLAGCSSPAPTTPDPTSTGTAPATVPPTSPTPGTGAGSGINDHGTRDVTAMERDVRLTMVLDDLFFEPTFVEARAGARVNLELENEGGLDHTFTIDTLRVDETLEPGKKTEIDFTLPQQGPVQLYCRFHRSDGMRGEFRLS